MAKVRSLGKWAPLPVGIGVAYISYQHFYRVKDRNDRKMGIIRPIAQWKVSLYSSLPLRFTSRQFGKLMDKELPMFLRKPIIGTYAYLFDCDMNEAVQPDVTKYHSLGEFFRRRIKSNLRPVSRSILVSPSDGKVHRAGKVNDGRLEQVKGIDYSLNEFVGPDIQLQQDLGVPPGLMLSVRMAFLDKLTKLLCLNERVGLHGKWKHGYFCMTAVAATNVGNIRIENDTLRTNQTDFDRENPQIDDCIYDKHYQRTRGDRIGEFRLGSSVVLIFEAPINFQFCVQPGDKVKYGQSLGLIRE